jgi:dUTP pyrophosphatase
MRDIIGPTLRLMRLPHGAGLALPSYETHGAAAGMDLRAAVGDERDRWC